MPYLTVGNHDHDLTYSFLASQARKNSVSCWWLATVTSFVKFMDTSKTAMLASRSYGHYGTKLLVRSNVATNCFEHKRQLKSPQSPVRSSVETLIHIAWHSGCFHQFCGCTWCSNKGVNYLILVDIWKLCLLFCIILEY